MIKGYRILYHPCADNWYIQYFERGICVKQGWYEMQTPLFGSQKEACEWLNEWYYKQY